MFTKSFGSIRGRSVIKQCFVNLNSKIPTVPVKSVQSTGQRAEISDEKIRLVPVLKTHFDYSKEPASDHYKYSKAPILRRMTEGNESAR